MKLVILHLVVVTQQNAKSAGEAHVTGVEFIIQVNNLFAAPQMKGAESVGSGIRYPMAVSVTLQEAEHDVTTKSSEFVDGARIAYTPEEIYYISLGAETNDGICKFLRNIMMMFSTKV